MSWEADMRTIVREELRAVLREEFGARGAGRALEPEPDLVALGEVRRWVQVSKSTLKEWIRRGELPKYGKDRIVRVKLDEVRALLQRRSGPATARTATSATSGVQRILASVPGGRR